MKIPTIVKVREKDQRTAGETGECFYCKSKIGADHKIDCVVRCHPSHDIEHKNPHGWIQWKGTEVCMDVYCLCGQHSHIDSDFTYHIKCPKCGQVYECDGNINLIPMDFEPKGTQVPEL